jgi:hypothetical protein
MRSLCFSVRAKVVYCCPVNEQSLVIRSCESSVLLLCQCAVSTPPFVREQYIAALPMRSLYSSILARAVYCCPANAKSLLLRSCESSLLLLCQCAVSTPPFLREQCIAALPMRSLYSAVLARPVYCCSANAQSLLLRPDESSVYLPYQCAGFAPRILETGQPCVSLSSFIRYVKLSLCSIKWRD